MTTSTRRPAWALCLMALVCVVATAALPGAVAERGPVHKALPAASARTEARVIVKYRADSVLMRSLSVTGNAAASASAPQHAQAMAARLGIALTDGRPIGARAQVVKGTGVSSRELADRLSAESDVEYAVVDGRMHALALPNDPLYGNNQTAATPASGQWYLRAPTSATIVDPTSVVSAINAEAAWNVSTGSAGVVVAVLDTGVRKDHPDLASKLLAGYDFVDASISNDGDGRDPDPSDPGDFETTGTPPVTADSSWHGTQTAGLIGAQTNNGIGMASVGRDVMLLPVRVLGIGGGFDSDIIAAMLWAGGLTANPVPNPTPAKVVNLSLGSAEACSPSYVDALAQLNAAGIVVVAAAGNDGLKVGSPASCPGAIAVAGVRHAGTKVGYSDLGPEVAISAPAGNCVNGAAGSPCLFPLLTTSNTGATTPVSNASSGSKYTDGAADPSLGTSFSAPLVSGTVGLMFSANPALRPSQVSRALTSTARPFPSTGADSSVLACIAPTAVAQDIECYCTTTTCGAGLTDAGAATLLASKINAYVKPSATTVVAGNTLTLDASDSWPSGAATGISTYQWSLTSGMTLASLTSSTSPIATVSALAAGAVNVTLTITDSAGIQGTVSVPLTVTPMPVPTQSSSGGGGGAVDPGWLLGLLVAVGALVVIRLRRG